MADGARRIEPVPVRAALLVHQEGVLALIAVIGLSFTERGLGPAVAPRGDLVVAITVGIAIALVSACILWLLRGLEPLQRLEQWQRGVVGGWSAADAVAVALVSGLAEEALLRAFLQPVIGLVPAAVLFAVLHLVPDRTLWFWPVFALAMGLVLGLVFDGFGYPAAAAAHIVVNLVALLRLRQPREE